MNPRGLLVVATVAYAALFSAAGANRYATFHSGADLGLFAQAIAQAGNGMTNTFEGGSHFVFHFSPILYLCAPLLWLTHSAVALIVVQAVATALTAPAIYLFARRRTNEANAAALGCIALLYPPLQGVTFTDFHETAFLPATIAWLLWAVDGRRFGWAALFAALALCIKEDQAVTLGFLGAVGCIYFARRRETAGAIFCAATAVAAAFVFFAYFEIVRPMVGAQGWMPGHFYSWFGYTKGDPLGAQIVKRLTYLLEVFLPLAFLPLRSRWMWLAVPGLIEVLASREPLMYTMGQHYAAVWTPYVLIAFADAGAALFERGMPNANRWIFAAGALCVLELVFFSPLHLGHFLRPLRESDRATNRLIARVPIDASVGSYDEIYAHLGLYPKAVVGVKSQPDYVIADRSYSSTTWNGTILPKLQADVQRGIYHIVATDSGVDLYERR